MDTALRILIIEDSDSDYQLVVRHLRKAGLEFDVVHATSREDYLAALNGPAPDLILSDYALPAFDGMTALALAHQVCPDTPFVFVTGALGEERAVETLKAGATDYVLKDRLARLAPAIERALEEAHERRKRREAEETLRHRTSELETANHQLAIQRAQLQALSHRLVQVQEAERQALSRDLHDTASQALTAVVMSLSRLARQPGHSNETREQISQLRQLAEHVVQDLRRLAVNLRPMSLDRYGLVAAVEQYLGSLRERGRLAFGLHLNGIVDERLPAPVETALYRIIQEAVANVIAHAEASSASVAISRSAGQIEVVIRDDGAGCDVKEALNCGRMGLLGMRERAEMLGGTMTIESAPGVGTTVSARIPLT